MFVSNNPDERTQSNFYLFNKYLLIIYSFGLCFLSADLWYRNKSINQKIIYLFIP